MADAFDPYREWLGISPDEQPPNHYRLLNIRPFENIPGVIRGAVDERTSHLKQFALSKYGVQSQTLLNEIAAAWVCLSDPEKKAAYDEQLREKLQSKQVEPRPERAAPKRASHRPDSQQRTPRETSPADGLSRQAKTGIIVGAAALGVLLLGGLVVLMSGDSETATPKTEPVKPAASEPELYVLALDWPEEERLGGTVTIDGGAQIVGASGPCQYEVSVGDHEIVATRRDYKPFTQTVSVGRLGATIRPSWEPVDAPSSQEIDPTVPPATPPGLGPDAGPYAGLSSAPPGFSGGYGSATPPGMAEATSRGFGRGMPQGPAGPGAAGGFSPPPVAQGMPPDWARLATRLRPAIVKVISLTPTGDRKEGKGLVVNQQGVVVTDYRLIDGSKSATIVFADGTSEEVTNYLAIHPAKELALLQVSAKSHPFAPLEPTLPGVGDRVAAVTGQDSPLGFAEGLVGSLPQGRQISGQFPPRPTQAAGSGPVPLDLMAQWIQTTVPIDQRYSGGPLVDARGVVGVFLWTAVGADKGSFALAAREIEPFVQQVVGGMPQPFPLAESGGADSSLVQTLVLPTGTKWDPDFFEVNQSKLDKLLDDFEVGSDAVFEALHNSLFQYAVYRHSKNKKGDFVLDGLAAAFHENDEMVYYAEYGDNNLNGLMMSWSPEGEPVYWGKYRDDKRDGLCCLFQDGSPWMVSEYGGDNLRACALIDGGELKSYWNEQALKDQTVQEALALLDKTQRDIAREYKKIFLNRLFSDEREDGKDARMARAASKAVQNRKAIQAKSNARRGATLRQIQIQTRMAH